VFAFEEKNMLDLGHRPRAARRFGQTGCATSPACSSNSAIPKGTKDLRTGPRRNSPPPQIAYAAT